MKFMREKTRLCDIDTDARLTQIKPFSHFAHAVLGRGRYLEEDSGRHEKSLTIASRILEQDTVRVGYWFSIRVQN